MPDPGLLDAVLADPHDGARWLDLARWFADNGREDEAAAVRTFWSAIRDILAAGYSLDSALEDVRRNAKVLGACARRVEGRADGRT